MNIEYSIFTIQSSLFNLHFSALTKLLEPPLVLELPVPDPGPVPEPVIPAVAVVVFIGIDIDPEFIDGSSPVGDVPPVQPVSVFVSLPEAEAQFGDIIGNPGSDIDAAAVRIEFVVHGEIGVLGIHKNIEIRFKGSEFSLFPVGQHIGYRDPGQDSHNNHRHQQFDK